MSEPGYLQRNRLPLGVVAAFGLAGIFFGPVVFPEPALWRTALAGGLLGAFAGLCGVCHQLLE